MALTRILACLSDGSLTYWLCCQVWMGLPVLVVASRPDAPPDLRRHPGTDEARNLPRCLAALPLFKAVSGRR